MFGGLDRHSSITHALLRDLLRITTGFIGTGTDIEGGCMKHGVGGHPCLGEQRRIIGDPLSPGRALFHAQ